MRKLIGLAAALGLLAAPTLSTAVAAPAATAPTVENTDISAQAKKPAKKRAKKPAKKPKAAPKKTSELALADVSAQAKKATKKRAKKPAKKPKAAPKKPAANVIFYRVAA
jgi:hypothetical protein